VGDTLAQFLGGLICKLMLKWNSLDALARPSRVREKNCGKENNLGGSPRFETSA